MPGGTGKGVPPPWHSVPLMRDGANIAILCPGPSLTATWLEHLPTVAEPYATILGVNSVVEACHLDWWVFADADTFPYYQPYRDHRPHCFTLRAMLDRLLGHRKGGPVVIERVKQFQFLCEDQFAVDLLDESDWKTLSMCMAIVLATELLQAGRIDCYGADWRGSAQWDGPQRTPISGGRTEYRWQNEQHKWGILSDWTAAKGVALRRVLP